MSLNLAEKQAVVAEVNEVASQAYSAIAAEYRGLTVSRMTDLRAQARKNGVYLRVVKNTLAKRALANTSFACMRDSLVGPLILAFSREDPGAAARLFKDFTKSKENEALVVKVLSISGRVLPPSDLDRLANLPTREQALSMLMAGMRAPLDKLARTMNEVPGKLVRTLAAIRDQKQAA
jgi:large subunit ribosomal protein L10